MFDKEVITNVKVRGQTVLVRVDYNVPINDGVITDDLRIRASFPTLELLAKKGARRIVLISHLGRPEGKKVPELSLKPVADRLKELLPDKKVFFVGDVSGPDVEEAVEKLPVGGILLLENLRFFPGEEKDSAEFAKEIVDATHADIFVQDGFAVVHRAHASTDAITKELPSVAGLLLEKEVTSLLKISESPAHPFVVIIGGAKVEDKQPLIDKFGRIADKIIVGGKISAEGYTSPLKNVYVVEDFSDASKCDSGPISTAKIVDFVKNAKTVLWNGLLGKAEEPEYATSSTALAECLGELKNVTSIICGGDTSGFVENLQKEHKDLHYSLVSTGGGAALELLCGNDMPGIDALDDKA
ncbi:phosphoglycerate kinase [Candidatus Saccharibacteria bacterium]|nr:phosphoglycerate kinase [Candidatus Saccharibacteria bacterium]